MRKYEVMYVLNASMDDAARQAEMDSIHAIITTNGGNIVKTDVWGVKEFAYEIEKETRGYYVVVDFETDNSACNAEFTRLCEINTNVIRQIVIAKPQ